MTHSPGLLQTALGAVADACGITRRVQYDASDLQAITKADKSPVTVADFAVQAIIAHRLQTALHPLALVGEETTTELRRPGQAAVCAAIVRILRPLWPEATTGDILDTIDCGAHDATGRRYWTLDPIDGTKGFLRGGQYAISLAYIVDGRVGIGILGCPNLSADFSRPFDQPDPHGLIVYATAGGGTWCAPADTPAAAPQRLVNTAPHGGAMRVCESVESAHSRHDLTARIAAYLGGAGAPARLDSQAKYAVVARGQADAYIRIPRRPGYVEKIWDHAAGMLVAVEAGAVVTDITGRPLDFSGGTDLSRNQGIVCATAEFHPRILEAIREMGVG